MNELFLLFFEFVFFALRLYHFVVAYEVNNVLDLEEISNIHRIYSSP